MRRQCRRFEFQRILLPVRMRIHWGMGRFWAIFFASVRFVRNVLCDGCGGREGEGAVAGASLSRDACVQRSADARWGRRDATTGGAFRRRSVRRSAAPLGRGARKGQGFGRSRSCVSAVGPGAARAQA